MPTSILVITQPEWDALQITIATMQASITALQTAAQNPNIIRADQLPGADAGLKIAAAIAQLPVGVGGLIDATAFSNPQNCTGFTIPPGVTVQLGPILYTLIAGTPSIVVNQGARLYGMANNAPGSTTLKAAVGFNKDVVKCISTNGETDYWHNAEVRTLRIDGNKANNTSGHGLSVYEVAETSLIQRLNILNAAQSGLYIKGSQSGTGSIENVTANSNGVYGVHIDEFRSGLTLKCVGGDQNPITFGITNVQQGGGSLLLIDPKSEGAGTGDLTASPVIRISGATSALSLTILGGNILVPAGITKRGVEITADCTVNPLIQILGLVSGNTMPILIDDVKNGQVVACAPTARHGFISYYAGKVCRLDQNGLTTLP